MTHTTPAPARCDAVEDGPLFHGGDAAGHAHEHAGFQPPAGRLGLAEEVAEHGLAEHEVGDHAAGQRADDGDPLRGAALHLPGHVTDRGAAGEDLAAGLIDGHDRRLIEHEPFAGNAHERVGGAQIDRQIATEVLQQSLEHPYSGEGGLQSRPAEEIDPTSQIRNRSKSSITISNDRHGLVPWGSMPNL